MKRQQHRRLYRHLFHCRLLVDSVDIQPQLIHHLKGLKVHIHYLILLPPSLIYFRLIKTIRLQQHLVAQAPPLLCHHHHRHYLLLARSKDQRQPLVLKGITNMEIMIHHLNLC